MEQTLIWAGSLVSAFGYVGLGVVLAANSVGLPIASEMILPLAGVAILSGIFDPTLTLITVVVAQMTGFMIAYLMARHAGVGLIEKYGHYFFISHRQVLAGQRLFRKHGSIVLLVGLCLPGVHGYMGYSAGLAKMRADLFLIIGLVGNIIWSLAMLGLGYLFGDRLPQIMELGQGAGLTAGIVLALIGLFIWYSRLHRLKTLPRRR